MAFYCLMSALALLAAVGSLHGEIVFTTPPTGKIFYRAGAGETVMTVHAKADDGSKLKYILSGGDAEYFNIEPDSGLITTNRTILKNIGEAYLTAVLASTTNSTESQFKLMSMRIHVTIRNEHPPSFNQTRYHSIMYRGETPGKVVVVTQAFDGDFGVGDKLVYSIVPGNYSGYFQVNRNNGTVTLLRPFPPVVKQLAFSVRVKDFGSPQYEAEVDITVYIRDVSAPRRFCMKHTNSSSALLCWQRSLHGAVTNYRLDYWPSRYPYNRSHVLMDVGNENVKCYVLTGLSPWTWYNARVYAHNFEEFSPSSAILVFQVDNNVCNDTAAVCSGNGRCSTTYLEPGYTCTCDNGYFGKNCEHFDQCSLRPCANNGVCRNISDEVFECECANGYYGRTCARVNLCVTSNPCVSGVCRNTSNNFRCECSGGSYGPRCEHFNPCVLSNVCLNGGSCQNLSTYSYKCSCMNGYYGSNCGKFDPCSRTPCLNYGTCRNISDTNYTCSCAPAFFGQDCEYFNPCEIKPNPCLNDGVCSRKSNIDVTCACQPGFYGHRCDSVDVCRVESPCQNGASCRNVSSGRYHCDCAAGWSGTNCTYYDPCVEEPCLNDGLCLNRRNNQSVCICSGGHYGKYCEKYDPCAVKPCKNQGRCSNLTQTTYQCACREGFYGDDCERFNPCVRSRCDEHGTCRNLSDTDYMCECERGYQGANCSVYNSCILESPCQHGDCELIRSHEHMCRCYQGYFGSACQHYNPCVVVRCGNGGRCRNLTNDRYRCECPRGYYGDLCEYYNPCVEEPCQNAGLCRNVSSANYVCTCTAGYFGKTCNRYNPCVSHPCQNHAICNNITDSNYSCSCRSGYYGTHCEYFNPCVLSRCINGATCNNISSNSFVCHCLNGFSGATCSHYDPCVEDPCINGGTCYNSESHRHECLCKPGFYGGNCENFDPCVRLPCLNNGHCTNTSNINYFCTCPDGFFGSHCQNYDFCSRVTPCENDATCSLINVSTTTLQATLEPMLIGNTTVQLANYFRCICRIGYTGERCETEINECVSSPCIHGSCKNLLGKYNCLCEAGYVGVNCELNINECASDPCQHGGECIDLITGYQCVCAIGWEGRNCHVNVNECRSNPCTNGGSCVDMLSAYRCVCPSGVYGTNCELHVNNCISNPCLNGGSCEDLIEDYYCACAPGYTGRICQTNVDECNSNPCIHGTCLDGVDAFTCTCRPGYKGLRCEEEVNECSSRPCKNNGLCHDLVNSFLCRCLPGFSGTTCEIDIQECTSNPCRNGATCIDLINGYKCFCPYGFTGVYCQNNIQECDSNPCQNGAACLDHVNAYSCVCSVGFAGVHCETNVNDCARGPCQHGATCVDRINGYTCICQEGYLGSNCQIEVDECSSHPCQNSGQCVDRVNAYTCHCRRGYSGPFCEIVAKCNQRIIKTKEGTFVWPQTKHGITVNVSCPYGAKNESVEGTAYATCSLGQYNDTAWSGIDVTRCKELNAVQAEFALKQLNRLTANPCNMTTDNVEEAATTLESLVEYAIQHRDVAVQMVSVLSSLMDADAKILRLSSANYSASERFRGVIDNYTANAVINNATDSIEIVSRNLRIKVLDKVIFMSGKEQDVQYQPAMNSTVRGKLTHVDTKADLQLTLPFEALRVSTPNETNSTQRIQFIAYQNSKFFVSKEKENVTASGDLENRTVLSASIKDRNITNLTKPVLIRFPVVDGDKVPKCVFWNESGKAWSSVGIVTNNKTDGGVLCEASHLTNFAILLDPAPNSGFGDGHNAALSYISYIGCGLSVLGLSLTLISFSLFPCLHREKSGKILINLCSSMLLMNISFLLGAHEGSAKNNGLCLAVAIFLHYFVLTTLLWMGVEAVHMYHVLIQIFGSYEERFLIKRCVVAWGIPVIVVGITVAVDVSNYRSKDEFCRLNYDNPYVYYISFLGPSCLILLVNAIIFIMLTRVILRPKLKSCKGKVCSSDEPKVTAAQVRGAITVMVLLGVTWIFGALAIGDAKLIFSYVFCIANSLQGFLIFIFRCFMYPEARMAWIQLCKQGTLKKRRGMPRSADTSSKGYDVKGHSRSSDEMSASHTFVTQTNLLNKSNMYKSRFKTRGNNSQKNLLSCSPRDKNVDPNMEYVTLEKLQENRSLINADTVAKAGGVRSSSSAISRPGELTRL